MWWHGDLNKSAKSKTVSLIIDSITGGTSLFCTSIISCLNSSICVSIPISTGYWAIILSLEWIVTPLTFTPATNAFSIAFSPSKAGKSEGCIFITLELLKLDTIQGSVSIKGLLKSFSYVEDNNKKEKESSLISRLFKWV